METTPKPTESAKPKSKKTMYAVIGVVIIVVIAVVALYAAGYFGGGTTAQVSIDDNNVCSGSSTACKYTPASYSAKVNDKVTWKNNGGQAHTVTFPDPAFASGTVTSDQTVQSGQSVSVTFSSAGTFHYYCTIHTWMKGNVTVS